MSGAEAVPQTMEGFIPAVSLGNILTIISIVTSVVAGAVAFTKYIKKDVRDAILESTSRIDNLADKIERQDQKIAEHQENTLERIGDVKEDIKEMIKRIDETRVDATRMSAERVEEARKLYARIDKLQEEHYKLNVQMIEAVVGSRGSKSQGQEAAAEAAAKAKKKIQEKEEEQERAGTEEWDESAYAKDSKWW